jgi:hypothetical protein
MATVYDCFSDECAEDIKHFKVGEQFWHICTIDIKASVQTQIETIEESSTNSIMSTERDDVLKRIAKEVMQLQEEYGKRTEGKTAITDKCRNFPAWDIVGELRALANKNRDNFESRLDALLTWPVPAVADPDLFYNGKHDKIVFNRKKDWFTTMVFKKFETPYTFTDRWDKKEMKATFLVPTNLSPKDPTSVMWFFHGGGFVSFLTHSFLHYSLRSAYSVPVLATIFPGKVIKL